ncbi:hypothetical protein CHL76_12120 [Marinococcus halophilus]|uniref:Uncharacterized protein n=1 Tax=Marinococcus halophilus TaxID=1371 RepID=A0A510Y7Q9_MARHA|nr:hypothetical protein CHL76_12120 [Marinococcus halophilus]GEK59406.1 hypothetical protein MHA01_23110 [Marinococcus halophilus]
MEIVMNIFISIYGLQMVLFVPLALFNELAIISDRGMKKYMVSIGVNALFLLLIAVIVTSSNPFI